VLSVPLDMLVVLKRSRPAPAPVAVTIDLDAVRQRTRRKRHEGRELLDKPRNSASPARLAGTFLNEQRLRMSDTVSPLPGPGHPRVWIRLEFPRRYCLHSLVGVFELIVAPFSCAGFFRMPLPRATV